MAARFPEESSAALAQQIIRDLETREELLHSRQYPQNLHSLQAMRGLAGEISHLDRGGLEQKVGQLRETLNNENTLFRRLIETRCAHGRRILAIEQGSESPAEELGQLRSVIERIDRAVRPLELERISHALMVLTLEKQMEYVANPQAESPIAAEIRRLEAETARPPSRDSERQLRELNETIHINRGDYNERFRREELLSSFEILPRQIQFSPEEKAILCVIYANLDLSEIMIFHAGKEVSLLRIESVDQWLIKERESEREYMVSPESLASCPRFRGEAGEGYSMLLKNPMMRRNFEYTLSEVSIEGIDFPPDSNAVIRCLVHRPLSEDCVRPALRQLRTLRDWVPGIEQVRALLQQVPDSPNYYLRPRQV